MKKMKKIKIVVETMKEIASIVQKIKIVVKMMKKIASIVQKRCKFILIDV